MWSTGYVGITLGLTGDASREIGERIDLTFYLCQLQNQLCHAVTDLGDYISLHDM
jgi:hypothetical protein